MTLRLALAAGVLVAFLALGGVMLWYRGEAIAAAADAARARADLATAVDVNKAQEETIGRLRAQQAVNDAILADMADKLAAISTASADTTKAIEDLKDANESVRDYLGGAVPADLGLRLNR